jgi:hypothetical protein
MYCKLRVWTALQRHRHGASMRLTLTKACPLKSGKPPDKAGGKWFCGECKENVHDISGMTADDAAQFLQMRRTDETLCGEWATDSDGNVLFNLGRAAVAAAALVVTAPAMADGLDTLPQAALIALFGEDGAQNVRYDLHHNIDTVTIEPPPTPVVSHRTRGTMIRPQWQTGPPVPTPTHKP